MSAKILVVEDEPDMLRIVTQTLSGAGYHVVPAFGGEDAMRKVKAQPFDLVLTDLAMPTVGGVEVIEQIKKDPHTCHIPVVAVTAYVWDVLAQSAGQVGCDGYIAKPFTPRKLLEKVRAYLRSAAGA
jgi:CheY-like chemotaxis protein